MAVKFEIHFIAVGLEKATFVVESDAPDVKAAMVAAREIVKERTHGRLLKIERLNGYLFQVFIKGFTAGRIFIKPLHGKGVKSDLLDSG